MKINCSHCNKETIKTLGYYNRAVKKGMKMFCSRKCAFDSRRTTKEEKIEVKRVYDIKYREKNLTKIKSNKKIYYETNKKEIYLKQRKRTDNDEHRKKHAEYCCRPYQRAKEKVNRYKRLLGSDWNNKTKFCIVCEKDKFILEFEHTPIYPDNRKHLCKECESEFQQETGYSTNGAITAMVMRRYTNLTRQDIAEHPYLIEANKYLIILKQLTK